MSQHPDYHTYIKALVLSANDVMATVLVLFEDEGYSPLNIATVSLPTMARNYRLIKKDGKAMFQRGDIIQIDCKIVEHKKGYFSEKAMSELLFIKTDDLSEEKAELFHKRYDAETKFAKEWAELEQRDLKKRDREY
jgi:hypothetical protein